jgi:tetratricopeptide (TPR) repeat protein
MAIDAEMGHMRQRLVMMAALAVMALAGPPQTYAQMGGVSGRQGPGGAGTELSTEAAPDKPDAAASKAFKAGLKALTKARDYDAAADKAPTADKRASELEKADDAYSRALDEFTEALANKGDMVEAWSDAGAIHLRLGAYAESVDDFNHALNLKADLYPAVEGRAEATLALDRLEETRTGYMDLSAHAPQLADKLLQAMQQWLRAHRQDPRGIGTAQLDGFDKWLQERIVAVAKAAP